LGPNFGPNGILGSHLEFLERMDISSVEIEKQETSSLLEMLPTDQRRLVDHNLSQGALKPSAKVYAAITGLF